MNRTDFWTSAGEELRAYALLSHPFYKAWTAGELTREDLGFYGWQYLHHVAAFPTYLTALHCRLPDCATRRAILCNAWEEEAQLTPHADLWRQFACAVNPAKSEGTAKILPEIRCLVETYRGMAESAPPPTALGAFYAYEWQVPAVAEAKLTGLTRFYGASGAACEYFELHRTADLKHREVWRTLINDSIKENPGSAREALDGVRRGARALWHALHGIEAARCRNDGR
jgi:pyrroloquinoline-quinone synthase